VIHVGSLENEKITVKPKDGIAEPIKVKKPIAKPKIAVGMVGVKKTWMIHLPQCCPHGLWGFYAGFGVAFFMWKIPRIAFFVDVTVKLWISSPDEGMDKAERSGHDTQKNTGAGSNQTN
jgi:hypothetical protein